MASYLIDSAGLPATMRPEPNYLPLGYRGAVGAGPDLPVSRQSHPPATMLSPDPLFFHPHPMNPYPPPPPRPDHSPLRPYWLPPAGHDGFSNTVKRLSH